MVEAEKTVTSQSLQVFPPLRTFDGVDEFVEPVEHLLHLAARKLLLGAAGQVGPGCGAGMGCEGVCYDEFDELFFVRGGP